VSKVNYTGFIAGSLCKSIRFTGNVTDDGTVEDFQMSFESALSWAIELMLSDDYEITQTDEFVSRSTGYLCRRYTISVNEV
jgi:hypothetical protein